MIIYFDPQGEQVAKALDDIASDIVFEDVDVGGPVSQEDEDQQPAPDATDGACPLVAVHPAHNPGGGAGEEGLNRFAMRRAQLLTVWQAE